MRRPARSRHCDRVKEVAGARAAPATGAPQMRPGKARPTSPGSQETCPRPANDNPRGKGGFNAKNRSNPAGGRVRAGPAPVRLAPPRSPSAKKVESRPARRGAKGKALAEETLKTGHDQDPDQHEGDCFGKGTGGSGKAAKITGPTALGLLGQAATSTEVAAAAADHRRLRLRPRDLRRRRLQRHREGILVPEGQPQEPGTRRRAGQAEAGRRRALGAAPVPLPEGAGAGSARPKRRRACRSRSASSPTTTRASASRPRERWSPAAPGRPTPRAGRPSRSAGRPTLRATHAKDIPSNGVGVCVLAVCP